MRKALKERERRGSFLPREKPKDQEAEAGPCVQGQSRQCREMVSKKKKSKNRARDVIWWWSAAGSKCVLIGCWWLVLIPVLGGVGRVVER